jgi:hypothetical protein
MIKREKNPIKRKNDRLVVQDRKIPIHSIVCDGLLSNSDYSIFHNTNDHITCDLTLRHRNMIYFVIEFF